MSDDAPKSAYEIALEKLKRRDRERGESAPAALTDGQKKSIAELRKLYEARLAEREILHRSERVKLLSHPEGAEKLEKLEEEYVKDRRRIEEQLDRAIEAARAGSGTAGEKQGRGRAGGPGTPRGKGRGPKAKILIAALGLGLLAPPHAAAAPAGSAGVAKEAAKPVYAIKTARLFGGGDGALGRNVVFVVEGDRIRSVDQAAALLGKEKELGRVAPGYLADLVAVPGNPLEDIAVMKKAGFVMAGGVIGKNDFGGD